MTVSDSHRFPAYPGRLLLLVARESLPRPACVGRGVFSGCIVDHADSVAQVYVGGYPHVGNSVPLLRGMGINT